MKTLNIDIETYSEVDLFETGVYPYVEHDSFEILMIAYSYNGGPVQIYDQENISDLPVEFMTDLSNPEVQKIAFNANFERVCFEKWLGHKLKPQQWKCTMVQATMLGFPSSLAKVGEALKLTEDKLKMKEGKALIQYFSKPCKPTKVNGGRTRNLPNHAPDRWELFKEYCVQDVVTEMEIGKILNQYNIPQSEWDLWYLDQEINDRGLEVDTKMVECAITTDEEYRERLMEEARNLTDLPNPNSLVKLKQWIAEKIPGLVVTGLTKKDVPGIIEAAADFPEVKRVLEIRQELGKTSTKKYSKLGLYTCKDNRTRGLLQFYGAKTGRWAGRGVQIHNLPQNKIEGLEMARSALKNPTPGIFEMIYGNVPDTLSQLIRTAFIAPEGKLLYVADFSAIEARMLAWLADEKWRMKVFNTHGKIYEASAAEMFNVPIETIAKGKENYSLRAKGKIAELALGYGGGANALRDMGALNMGILEEELQPLVDTWRNSNKAITNLWWSIDKCVQETIANGCITETHGLHFYIDKGILFIGLQSGRSLAYVRPKIKENSWGKPTIEFEGMDQTTKKWTNIKTYGPKLVENIVQALSRDCLAHSMKILDNFGYPIVMHVHDEAIIEGPENNPDETLKSIEGLMGIAPDWAEGFPLNAEGYYSKFYKKD